MRIARRKPEGNTRILQGLFLARIQGNNDPSASTDEREEKMKTVFVNPERCIRCPQCESACAVEHSKNQDAVGTSDDHDTDQHCDQNRKPVQEKGGDWFEIFHGRSRYSQNTPS